MSPRRTRRGTARDNTNEICIDNSFKSTSKTLRSTRYNNRSQIVKGLEEDSDNHVEVNSSLGNIISSINNISSNKKKRQRKTQEVLINQDSSLSVTIEESKNKSRTKNKNLKIPKSKTKVKTNKSQIIDATSLISEDESSDIKSQKEETQVSYIIHDLISEDEEISEPVIRKRLKLHSQNSSLHKKECKTPEKLQKASSNRLKSPDKEITPKSSPINVSLTPHRSTKTPKKSPMNLGSPKTHSHDSLKLLNVQRKLSITDSPTSSEKSHNSLHKPNSSDFDNASFEKSNKSGKSSKSVLKSSSKKKSISPILKVRPKFSKSPKIVLRTPKSKSSKSKKASSKRKLSVSPLKSNKSPNINKSLKSEKTPTSLSVKSKKKQKVDSFEKSENELNLSVKFEELSKIEKPSKSISSKSRKSPKTDSPLKYKKLTKALSPVKLKKSPEKDSQLKSVNSSTTKKSKKSPLKITSPINSTISPVVLSSSTAKKSPTITPLISKKMPKIILSSKKSSKSTSSSKSKKSPKVISLPKTEKIPAKSFKNKVGTNKLSKNSSLSPRVIIKKLSSPQLTNSNLDVKTNQPTVNLVPVDLVDLSDKSEEITVSVINRKSPKSFSKKKSVTKSVTLIKSIKSEIDTSTPSIVNLDLNKNTPSYTLEKNLLSLKPANTSTPREKMKHTFSLVSNKKNKSPKRSSSSILLNGSSTPKPNIIKRLKSQSSVNMYQPLLADESKPYLNDTSLIHMSDFDLDNSQRDNTFKINKSNLDKRKSLQDLNVSDKSNKINNTYEIKKNNSSIIKVKSIKDDTYELENSKIGLQMKSNKRTLNEHELDVSGEPEPKKNCRVRFDNSNLKNHTPSNLINRVSTPGHAIQQKKLISISKNKTPSNQSFANKIENRRRVSSVSKLQVKTPVNNINARRSNSVSDLTSRSRKSNHETQIASVNRLSRPKPIINSEKKLGIKTPIIKKIPNFTEIHQKNFAKMESLVDLKKRVEKRHISLNTATSSTKKKTAIKYQSGNKSAPSDSTNGVYNKFGFKIRKNDAVNIISNKQAGIVESREKKREDARNVLKGVRMNRRFELQMKSRIKNS